MNPDNNNRNADIPAGMICCRNAPKKIVNAR